MAFFSPSRHLSEIELRNLYRESYVQRYHQRDAKRIATILQNIQIAADEDVVDYACGNGLLLEYLRGKVAHYIGVDFSLEFIQEAKRRFPKLPKSYRFVSQDIVAFSTTHLHKFDTAFALDFSEHIYDDQFLRIFSAIRKTLKPKGQLVLHTPNADFFLEQLKQKNVLLHQFPEHIGVRNSQQYKNLLLKTGFTKVTVRYLPHYNPLLRPLDFFHYLPGIGKYFQARILITAQS